MKLYSFPLKRRAVSGGTEQAAEGASTSSVKKRARFVDASADEGVDDLVSAVDEDQNSMSDSSSGEVAESET